MVIVDDHDRYRDGLVRYLRRRGTVGEVTSTGAGPEAIGLIVGRRPTIAVVDLGGGAFDAVEIWRHVRDVDADLAARIVAMALEPDGPSAVAFRRLTGGEVLDKAASRAELSQAIERRSLRLRRPG